MSHNSSNPLLMDILDFFQCLSVTNSAILSILVHISLYILTRDFLEHLDLTMHALNTIQIYSTYFSSNYKNLYFHQYI